MMNAGEAAFRVLNLEDAAALHAEGRATVSPAAMAALVQAAAASARANNTAPAAAASAAAGPSASASAVSSGASAVPSASVAAAAASNSVTAARMRADRSSVLRVSGLNGCIGPDELQAAVAAAAGISARLIDKRRHIHRVTASSALVVLPSPFHVVAALTAASGGDAGSSSSGGSGGSGGSDGGSLPPGAAEGPSASSPGAPHQQPLRGAVRSLAQRLGSWISGWWSGGAAGRGGGGGGSGGDNMLGFPGVSHAVAGGGPPAAKRRAVDGSAAVGADGGEASGGSGAGGLSSAAMELIDAASGNASREGSLPFARPVPRIADIPGALAPVSLRQLQVETYEEFLERHPTVFGEGKDAAWGDAASKYVEDF